MGLQNNLKTKLGLIWASKHFKTQQKHMCAPHNRIEALFRIDRLIRMRRKPQWLLMRLPSQYVFCPNRIEARLITLFKTLLVHGRVCYL